MKIQKLIKGIVLVTIDSINGWFLAIREMWNAKNKDVYWNFQQNYFYGINGKTARDKYVIETSELVEKYKKL